MEDTEIYLPQGFEGHCLRVGLKQSGSDCCVIRSTAPAYSAAMFTQSLFSGASVEISRESDCQKFQGMVVLSKNANVATGAQGRDDAQVVRALAAEILGLEKTQVLIASTGVIGQPYPMASLTKNLNGQKSVPLKKLKAIDAATAIMTTDTKAKFYSVKCGAAQIVGIAKGVGMIEPDMATMLAFFFTDAKIDALKLDQVFRRVVEKTFNATSIDTDTSTSDTAAIFANGLGGDVAINDFETALYECALYLVKMITMDGEGATKSIVVQITGARDDGQAKRVAKSVVNSPLVKTAVNGADPNWGRVIMAIGKLSEEKDIVPDNVKVYFGDMQVYQEQLQDHLLPKLIQYLQGKEINIYIDLAIAEGCFTVYGCDLSEGYIRINADYTT